ncbi:PRC-barrel domain-containing protein [Paraburkholderia sp. Ac-20347]|jgi:sporulation protein YlmC with PRC-barrel domain|uniref:PRC-barrel domain-containing protein n=1 Tax=Paraburkholderia sp. Ac-20347 TaxID=2703892 RepID=UPI00197D6EDF|nr:PRC-barrel domain-containing protein [Paraburkholderia sp. Ac-20347]MBN3810451.1 PRC-barrel domain containing protein [Paraburkholderia sp. Ac-20347]
MNRRAISLAAAIANAAVFTGALGSATLVHAQGAPQSIAVQRMATVQSGTGFRASKLVGSNVYDNNGSKIGSIDDIVLESPNDGAFAILSVGGFLGMGEHLVAVPFNDLQISAKQIVLQTDKTALKAMPEFHYAKD